jgi:glyoxylase-like metal-dependent hydrolase (beta-lactamase superfamily II)
MGGGVMSGDCYRLKRLAGDVVMLYGYAEECYMFLVTGGRKALLIDTGMGIGDIRSAIKSVTPLPVCAVNTHGHIDHCGGNSQFEEVLLSPNAYADADSSEEQRESLPHGTSNAVKARFDWKRLPVCDGDTIDLGGRKLEIIDTPGHTPGCISLLDKDNRLLFAGDLIGSNKHCTHMLAGIKGFSFSTVSIETFHASLKKIAARDGAFDLIYGGHDDEPLGKEYLYQLLDLTGSILEGTARPYHPELGPNYGGLLCWKLEGKNTAILYHDEIIYDKKGSCYLRTAGG